MTKPLYFWNGSSFELVGPTTPQSPFAYQTSAPTAPATGDIWIDSDGDVDTYNRQLTRYYFVASAGQTSVSGTDANGLTLAYVAGSEAVYINGALQVRGVDYTATNGTSITGLSALALNDVVEVFAYTAFTVANAYTKSETDSVAAAAAGLRMVVPTSVAVGSGTGSANSAGYVTFSGASSVSLNGVFNSTYDNYKILIVLDSQSASDSFRVRMRASGTDATGSDYGTVQYYGTTGSGTMTVQQDASIAYSYVGDFNSTGSTSCDFTIFKPFLAVRTKYNWHTTMDYNGATRIFTGSGIHKQSTSYDGITFYPASGNITGTIAVYGYKD